MLFQSKNVKCQIKETVMGKGSPWGVDPLTQELKITQTVMHEVERLLNTHISRIV